MKIQLKKSPYKQLVLVEFRNCSPFIYNIISDKPISIDKVVQHFIDTEDFNGNPFGHNDKKPDPVKPLRGVVLRAKLALENKKKVLLKNKSSGKFAPDIIGKRYASNSNAQRTIKKYTTENHAIIPAGYKFGINKIDWGCYEITGNKK